MHLGVSGESLSVYCDNGAHGKRLVAYGRRASQPNGFLRSMFVVAEIVATLVYYQLIQG